MHNRSETFAEKCRNKVPRWKFAIVFPLYNILNKRMWNTKIFLHRKRLPIYEYLCHNSRLQKLLIVKNKKFNVHVSRASISLYIRNSLKLIGCKRYRKNYMHLQLDNSAHKYCKNVINFSTKFRYSILNFSFLDFKLFS